MTASSRTFETEGILAESDPTKGEILAKARFPGSMERLFKAISTSEICDWWVRPGVFDTKAWSGDLRVGGQWTATGTGRGQDYRLEGVFTAVDAPVHLSQTWLAVGSPAAAAQLTHTLSPSDEGVELVLQHNGIADPDVLERTRAGWETSLIRLREIIDAEQG